MKLVQVIPIPVTYSRNLKSFLAERSWIYYSWQSTSLSLSLFEEVSNNWNEEARWYPAARYFREFILVAVFSRLDDHRPSYLGPRGKSAKPRKMPHENIGPLFTAKDDGAIFKENRVRAIVEKSWKNSFSERTNYWWRRGIPGISCCATLTTGYGISSSYIRAKLLRPRWCIGTSTVWRRQRIPRERNISFEIEREELCSFFPSRFETTRYRIIFYEYSRLCSRKFYITVPLIIRVIDKRNLNSENCNCFVSQWPATRTLLRAMATMVI